jgi:hypothetical protein
MRIEEYVDSLDRRLTGPRRVKQDMLAEARDSLVDAAEAYEAGGLAPGDAQARAVAEFGAVGPIAGAYQRELAATVGRRLALLVALYPIGAILLSDLMWRGAPWSGATSAPASYGPIARALDWMPYVLGTFAVVALVALRRLARGGEDPRRLCLLLGTGTIALLGAATGLGAAIWFLTVVTWPAALTWPPMIIGGIAFIAVFTAQLAAALRCLRVARSAVPVRPVPRRGTC